jgi:hypothetical protein
MILELIFIIAASLTGWIAGKVVIGAVVTWTAGEEAYFGVYRIFPA